VVAASPALEAVMQCPRPADDNASGLRLRFGEGRTRWRTVPTVVRWLPTN